MNAAEQPVTIQTDQVSLLGDLALPRGARGIVLFAHGSGSGRHSPRNRAVAQHLNQLGLGTLLIDLLTLEEERIDERTRHLRFDIPLLADRLVLACDWLSQNDLTRQLRLGLFGASTGAAAALIAATQRSSVAAVVSRGGRPDLAGPALMRVRCPVQLIVGQRDEAVIELNEQAMQQLRTDKQLVIIPNATHLFEEPGTLEQVAQRAGDWLRDRLEE